VYAVSRSGYYKWLGRRGVSNQYEQAQQKLDFHIADIHAHHPAMGYRQLRDKLAMETDLSVCDLTVWKSMKRIGINGFVRRRKLPVSVGGMAHCRYPNLLNRQFGADRPMQKIVTDVTYIKHQGKWYYLALYLDLFNNEILEWELCDTFDHFLVIHPAQRLLKKVSTEHQVLLHSDQGVQYSSAGFCSLLQRYNVTQSMSRAGNPYDNAVMESFFGRFKDILRSHFRFWTLDDLAQTVASAVHYFNFVRPVRKLKGKTPVQFRIEQVP
jgi:transposase InsO family protein